LLLGQRNAPQARRPCLNLARVVCDVQSGGYLRTLPATRHNVDAASQDLFADFDQVFQTLTPWIRNRGLDGGQRRTGFHMALDGGHTLLVSFKRNKWNQRDRDHFDFLLETYIKDETSDFLIWYWKSSTDAGSAMGRSSAQWGDAGFRLADRRHG
jgi:hypothetical protein